MGELTDLLLVICAVLLGFVLAVCLYLAFQSTRANRRLRTIMATQEEAVAMLQANNEKMAEVVAGFANINPVLNNIAADIERLKAAAEGAANISPELQAAIDSTVSHGDQLVSLKDGLAAALGDIDVAGGDPPVEDPEG
jgi:hypothetical protein